QALHGRGANSDTGRGATDAPKPSVVNRQEPHTPRAAARPCVPEPLVVEVLDDLKAIYAKHHDSAALYIEEPRDPRVVRQLLRTCDRAALAAMFDELQQIPKGENAYIDERDRGVLLLKTKASGLMARVAAKRATAERDAAERAERDAAEPLADPWSPKRCPH